MNPRYVPFLLPIALFCVAMANAGTQQAPHISKQTRMDLIRAFNAELVYIRAPFPMGKTGLTLKNGTVSPEGEELQNMLAMWGPAVKPGDQAMITQIQVKNDRIHFEINGGPVKKQKWYQHIQVGGSASTMSTVGPSDSNANPRGSYVDLVFDGYVPDMGPQELKDLLRPVFDFNAKSSAEAYLDTLPPKLRDAVKAHQILVGMNREMVIASKGRPPKKIREKDGEVEYEEWIYGEPPQDVDFVRLVGDEVVRLESMKVDGQKIVHTEKEVDLGTVAKSTSEPEVRPPNAPSLRRPGEEVDTSSPAGGRVPMNGPPPDPLGTSGPSAPPN